MKLNNLEKDIRNKLNERSIQPSKKTWNKLDELLTASENIKTKRRFNWLYMAASITGISLIAIYMLIQNSSIEKNDALLVEQEKAVEKDSTKTVDKSANEIIINPIKSLQIARELAEIKQHKHSKTKQTTNEIKNKQQTINTQNDVVLASVFIDEKTANQENKLAVNPTKLLTSIENKEEIILKNNSIKVNVNSLLSQVDGELSQTFTEKALQSIHKNYQNLKEVIASRNIKE